MHDLTGDHARAINEAIRAEELAVVASNPAEQVRSLNVLLLANIGRRYLVRAEERANEAYTLAERIVFTCMMAYVRANLGWLYALKNDPAKQYQALTDALQITRSHPALPGPNWSIL